MQIVKYPHPILREKGTKVESFDEAFALFIEEMTLALNKSGGVGLAAQQVGFAIQTCIIDMRGSLGFDWRIDGWKIPLELCMPLVIVNPQVNITKNQPYAKDIEGCLSFPNKHVIINRPTAVFASFQDIEGKEHTLECTNFFARCLLHEVDHLNGILFIDRN